jgi:hypothetical protein
LGVLVRVVWMMPLLASMEVMLCVEGRILHDFVNRITTAPIQRATCRRVLREEFTLMRDAPAFKNPIKNAMKLRLTKILTAVALTFGALGLSSCYHHNHGGGHGKHRGHDHGGHNHGNGHDRHDH